MSTQALQPYIGADIPNLTESLCASVQAQYNVTIPFEVMAAWLSVYVEQNTADHFSLSKTRPDFEGIKIQFIARIRQTKAWKDVIQAGWGETLSEFFAAVGDYGQESIMRAYQESGSEARLSASMYMQMRSLGVHIDRVLPAQVTVGLWGEEIENETIPELSMFAINGVNFFNRSAIQFNYNTTQDNPLVVTLYQGTIVTEPCVSRGVPFQYFEIGDENSNISNVDLYCYASDGTPYIATAEGLWHFDPDALVFYQNMTPSGNVEILFGNGVFGAIPPVDQVLNVMYASSIGDQANSAEIGLTVALSAVNQNVPHRIRNTDAQTIDDQIAFLTQTVTGITTGPIINGEALKDKEFYRAVGPSIRASNRRMVNRLDHYAQGLRYPGLADVRFQGQKELAPHDRRFTNVIGVTVLQRTGIAMTDAEWSLFVDYLTTLAIWGRGVEFLRIDPVPVPFTISGDVYMTNDSDTTNVGAYLRYTFNQFFRFQRGSLGKSVYGSDLEALFKFRYDNMTVDFVKNVLPAPDVDTILLNGPFTIQYPVLANLTPGVFYSGRNASFVPPREVI